VSVPLQTCLQFQEPDGVKISPAHSLVLGRCMGLKNTQIYSTICGSSVLTAPRVVWEIWALAGTRIDTLFKDEIAVRLDVLRSRPVEWA